MGVNLTILLPKTPLSDSKQSPVLKRIDTHPRADQSYQLELAVRGIPGSHHSCADDCW